MKSDSEQCVPKLIGGDVELANFIVGKSMHSGQSDHEASRRLLREVDGVSQYSNLLNGSFDAQDVGRRYLPSNGGCIYIDLNHLELATPEALTAQDYQAVWNAMLLLARQAQVAANNELAEGHKIVVLANNSDRQGNSYGGHQSFLMSRKSFDDMIRRRMIPGLFYLMAYQVSSIVFTGQGKVGSENGHEPVPFQLHQRADFIETLVGEQTTFNRPLVNTRDEPLCGPTGSHTQTELPGDRFARLHVIFYDTNLAPVATYLKVGVMQLILAMIEAEQIDESLILEDPLTALHSWSRDPHLQVHMPLRSGQTLTAAELQLKFLDNAKRFADQGGFDGVVAGADEILTLWEDTLRKLIARDLDSLRGRIDWIAKYSLLENAIANHSSWDWDSPQLTVIDQTYSSIDPADSLFLALEANGAIEPVASEDEIAKFLISPPENTRAWSRAMLLRAIGRHRISQVDWDKISIGGMNGFGDSIRIGIPDPLKATRSDVEAHFLAANDLGTTLRLLADAGVINLGREQHSSFSATGHSAGIHEDQFNHYGRRLQ